MYICESRVEAALIAIETTEPIAAAAASQSAGQLHTYTQNYWVIIHGDDGDFTFMFFQWLLKALKKPK